MKRSAERQISKDDDDEIEEVEDPGKGFQKADDSVLTKRQIRALPKRTMSSNKASSFTGFSNAPPPSDSESQKFGGFTGFGSGASSPFSFIPSASSETSTISSSASAATKSFASLVQSASATNVSQPSPSNASDGEYEATLKYYKSVRGLNVSFLSAIQKAVDQDPFVDIAGLLESYKNLRTTVQVDLDSSSKPASQKKPLVSGPGPSPPPVTEKTAPSGGFPAPKVFNGFSGFSSTSLPSPSTNSNTTTEKISAPQSTSFTASSSGTTSAPSFITSTKPTEDFPAPAAAFSKGPASAFSFGIKPEDPSSSKSNSFSFAAPPAHATSKGKEDSVVFSPPVFGSSSSIPNFFTSSKLAPSAFSESSLKPSSAFGATSLSDTNTDSNKPSFFSHGSSDLFNKVSTKSDTGKDETKGGTTGNLFGGSSFTPSTNPFGLTSAEKPTSAFGTFGGGSPPKGNGFTFGKVGGSIGNPVGFGFGVTKPADGPSEVSSSVPTGSSFGVPSVKSASPPVEAGSRSESQACSDEGAPDDAKALPTSNHDVEGEGEEDEETVYTVKAKLFRLAKTSDKSEWKDLGIGMFRLKRHKETSARRALMRNSSTGRIIINFRLFATLNTTLTKKTVSFVGHDDGAPASFQIRVKTLDQAQELKDALDRQVADVKESN